MQEASDRAAGTLRRSEPWHEPSLATATNISTAWRSAPGAKRRERE
jgi:hypothetical protein